jgi:NTP pyrophosphatase (non-canonical NTP hydrolase)
MTLKELIKQCAKTRDVTGFKTFNAEHDLLVLMSEAAEAFDAYRDDPECMSDHFKEEIADIFIIWTKFAQYKIPDIEKYILMKLQKNENRGYHHGRKV